MKPVQWFFRVLFLVAGLTVIANAGCAGAPEIPTERVNKVRGLLLGENTTADFHLYSEAVGTQTRTKFLLYSVGKNSGTSPEIYLAGLTAGDDEKLLFTHNLNYYIPSARAVITTSTKPVAPEKSVSSGPLTFDGCLNTFTISPKREGIHLNIFAKSASLKTEGANDVILVLLENNFIEPVLELTRTSFRFLAGRDTPKADSLLAIPPSTTGVTEVIWQEFVSHEVGSGIMGGKFSQNAFYHWEDKGFKKAGTFSPSQLTEHLKAAVELPRCSSITRIRFEYKLSGPNQPAP